MIDHFAIDVSDLKKSGRFYGKALEPLGYKSLMDTPQEFGGRLMLGWGDQNKTDLYIGEGLRNRTRLHIAFRVPPPGSVNPSPLGDRDLTMWG